VTQYFHRCQWIISKNELLEEKKKKVKATMLNAET